MDRERAKERLRGCYLTVPTMFRDPDLELDLDATGKIVRHILDGGFDTATGELLSGGAAGDFSTMTFDERCRVCEAILEEDIETRGLDDSALRLRNDEDYRMTMTTTFGPVRP